MLGEGQLRRLSSLLKRRNAVDAEIAGVIGRPAHPGHIADFVAAEIFGIDLLESASHKGIDGYFGDGPLKGRSVNVNYLSKREGLLNLRLDNLPDFYLVLTGPKGPAASSRGTTQPWVIDSVFLFHGPDLVQRLKERGRKIGIATSVRGHYWDEAEIYPSRSASYRLSPAQRDLIEMFG